MRYDIEAEPSKPRIREYVLALVCCALLVAWLDSGNLGARIIEDRQEQARPALSYPAAIAKCERNTRVAIAALNGWNIETDEVKVSCRVKQKES